MRFIPTSDITVENLKKQAKKLQRKLGGKHTDLLNRVAKSANYDHWHHVIKCHAQTTGLGNHALIAECFKIVSKAKKGIVSAIFTGPQTSNKPFILFSTEDGDAWLLDPREKLVSNLMWQGQENQLRIDEDSSQIKIDFDGRFDIKNGFFEVWIPEPNQLAKTIGHRSIVGYPVLELQQLMGAANDLLSNRPPDTHLNKRKE